MRIIPVIAWTLEGPELEPLDDRLMPLLEAISTSASLAAAVGQCGISYRAGWGLLRDYQQKLGVALVSLERGRGATLTTAGERLLAARAAATSRLARVLPGLATDIESLQRQQEPVPALTLRMSASHDLALLSLAEALPAMVGLNLELSSMGSLHALEELAAGRADLAGFHVPISGCTPLEAKTFSRWLHSQRDRLIRFVDREQGLILPHGNPAHVRSVRNLASKGLRFVNRQRGSGTRLLFDQLLKDAMIAATAINGYRTEEFTHAAVAATVASGGADAGFGVRAAAADYQLAFVPLARERYFLAVRSKSVKSLAVDRLISALRSSAFKRLVRSLPGYEAVAPGTVVKVDALGTS